jgi:hypothetical protein
VYGAVTLSLECRSVLRKFVHRLFEGFHLPKVDRGQAGANITDDAPQNKRQDAIDAISPSCALTELGIAGI